MFNIFYSCYNFFGRRFVFYVFCFEHVGFLNLKLYSNLFLEKSLLILWILHLPYSLLFKIPFMYINSTQATMRTPWYFFCIVHYSLVCVLHMGDFSGQSYTVLIFSSVSFSLLFKLSIDLLFILVTIYLISIFFFFNFIWASQL